MKNNHKKLWLIKGGVGALLIGTGICCIIEVAFLKHSEVVWWKWVSLGTVSLAIFMGGISTLVDSVRHKIKMND